MSAAGASAAGAAAAGAAIAQAIKASGAIIKMSPAEFSKIVNRSEKPVVVTAKGGFFKTKHQYLTSYGGLFFYTNSPDILMLPGKAETIIAEKIWIP